MSTNALALADAVEPDLVEFFSINGRLPFVDDKIKPWEYRGWLIPYIQLVEDRCQLPPRYGYLLKTLSEGKILDEPIPPVEFCSEFQPQVKDGLKQLKQMVEIAAYEASSWNAFREICQWLGYALSTDREPSKMPGETQEKLYRLFNLGKWLTFPTDYLGHFLAQHNGNGWNPNSFYPTPMHLCDAMTRITFPEITDETKYQTVCDPSGVGSGRFLLYASNYSLRLYGQDIDQLCVLITKINLAIYAPWHHIPESFFPKADPSELPHPVKKKRGFQASLFDLA